MKKIKYFIKKYCYITIPILVIAFIMLCNRFYTISVIDNDSLQTLIGVSGTLIGFLFTAMTIFFSLNKNSQYMQNFKKYNHHIIFGRLVTIGLTMLCASIVTWIFNFNKDIIIILFIIGGTETLMAAYYVYKLSLNSFN